MKRLIGLTILTAFICVSSHAQSHLSEEKVNSLIQLKYDLEGTYQIEMIDTRSLPSIELTVFETIANLRDSEKIVYHRISSNMRVKILPFKEIEKPDFVPLDYYTFVNSNKIKAP